MSMLRNLDRFTTRVVMCGLTYGLFIWYTLWAFLVMMHILSISVFSRRNLGGLISGCYS
ncbi:hypothetical protein CY34DRAFT_809269, partial [Suillus luteus UH-Slu-Lm8-n1]